VLLTYLQLTLLLLVANGAPVVAKNLLGARWTWPVDFGLTLPDGQRLFGSSCTFRGWVAALAATAVAAWLLGLEALTGLAIGALAMTGDMLSSFIKRRLGMPPGSMALGLDQIPESLFPLLWARAPFALGWGDVAALTLIFLVLELLLSRILYRFHLRSHPY
jgi:CDP-2,3-bis-(O-geranylgeranyl)-sn-glycerol synthase